MTRAGGSGRESWWLSASEVGDYAYCPRSFWYSRHPPARGRSETSRRGAIAGDRFHAVYLGAEQARSAHRGTARTVLVVAVIVALLSFLGALLA